ncbi:hypothetical protein NOC27_836 [Nitrosococcus oceani AFC27]|uniref:hypothetical protein n=1 Tax=Nitrosococcus oceani TaxID=1229 RepID=UPI000183C154|nr:hypothetical protein [Nitrosococcus oceani]EDZ67509.1 hypothetical protein NOC27_836 [Nitrosococcus oceani AFC27]GEM18700.1 hypothetical protein NONS58_00560 [Nitrosococcus oceani]
MKKIRFSSPKIKSLMGARALPGVSPGSMLPPLCFKLIFGLSAGFVKGAGGLNELLKRD